MAPTPSIPSQIAGYHVLPLSLPPLPSFPTGATHYLYIGLHQPKVPTPKTARSLFLVDVPFDATALHLKHLLSQQMGLPGGRIEDVLFEGQQSKDMHVEYEKAVEHSAKKSKKRKRRSELTDAASIKGAELPSTWDRELLTGSMTAVVIFIDKPSADAVLKAVKKIRREESLPVWGEGLEGKLPALGSASTLTNAAASSHDLLTLYQDIFSTTNSPTPKKVCSSNPSINT